MKEPAAISIYLLFVSIWNLIESGIVLKAGLKIYYSFFSIQLDRRAAGAGFV